MGEFYGPHHRQLQDDFDSRRLADAVEERLLAHEITEEHRLFIENRDMFWLASIDDRGRPTVSYKGGAPGFIRVLDNKTIAFPSYDGNGMFYSMGNIAGNENVGLLFTDFERPNRLRVQGTATIDPNDPLLGESFEAQIIVRVAVTDVFKNCPRYVHRYERAQSSKYVPQAGIDTPYAGWKRVDGLQDALPAKDQGRAEQEGGLRTREQQQALIAAGDPEA